MAPLDGRDLPEIRERLNNAAASALQWLFPRGRLIRNEFSIGDISGTEGDSLRFNVRRCTGADFNSGEKGFGGVLDVFVAKAGNFPDGLDLARQFLGIPEDERPQPRKGAAKGRAGASDDSWTQIIPPPADAGRPEFARLWPGATFRAAWAYRDAAGGLLFHVARYEWVETGKDGKRKLRKVTPAVTWGHGEDGRRHWKAKGKALDILFGLEELAARPDAPVLVVEGEKAAVAARLLFPGWVVVAWKGGSKNARHIDVGPLAGRDVVLWPDADEDGGGTRAMETIGKAAIKAGATVRMVVLPPGLPDGWDLADDLPNGWTSATLESLLVPDGAIGKATATPKRPAGLLDCAAYYPTDRLAPEIASLEMRRAIARFLDEATLYLQVLRDYNAVVEAAEEPARAAAAREASAILDMAQRERVERATFRRLKRQARREAMAAVSTKYRIERLPRPPRLQLKASAGIGKTSVLAMELAKRPDLIEHFHIDFYVPRHDLTETVAAAIPGSRVMRGRSFGADDGSPMCQRNQAADRIARAGLPVFENICMREGSACPFFEGCAWVNQWRDHAPGVRILPHAFLALPKPLGMPPADLVIVDESVLPIVTESLSFSPCRITKRQFRPGMVDECVAHERTAEAVAVAIQANGAELAQARDLGVTAEQLREAAKFEEAGEAAPLIGPGMTDTAIIQRLEEWDRSEGGKLAKFYRSLAAEIDLPRDAAHGIEVKRDQPMRVRKDDGWVDERQDRVFVHWLKRPKVRIDAALLLIDADASLTINRRIFGDRLEERSIRVRRHAHVIQVHSSRFAKSRMVLEGPEANHTLGQIKTLIERESRDGKRVLVVTYKAVRCLLTGEHPEDDIGAYGRCGSAAVAHFGNVRGSDDFKDYDTVLVVGRYQPPVYAVESAARALWATDPAPLRLAESGGRYGASEPRGYTLRSGERAGVEVERHPDDRAQMVLELMREAETVQSVDRLRLVHRTEPGRVLLVSNLSVDVDVDELTNWKGLMAMGAPSRLQQAFDRGGAVPLSAAELARCFDDLWTSEGAAHQWLRRNLKGYSSLIEFLLGFRTPLILARYRRPGQRGQATRAAIRADTPDPRAALEAVVGPVVWFEIEGQAQTEAQPVDAPTSQAAPEPDAKAGRVVPIRPPPPPTPLESQRLAIVLGASRLADLAMRLDRFRPPELIPRRAAHG